MKIGIDIGGSHINVGIISENGSIICNAEKDIILAEEKFPEIALEDKIQKLIKEVTSKSEIDFSNIELIGISAPGRIREGKMDWARNLKISNYNITGNLANIYKKEVILNNDAKCAALAEKEYGSLKQYDDAVFLAPGTGIGGAVFLGRKIVKT
jgi:glucokinase